MDCLLLFPPGWDPCQPYLSLPILKAELEFANIRNSCLDLNILFYEYLTSKTFIEKAVDTKLSPEISISHVPLLEKAKHILKSNLFYKKRYREYAYNCFESYFSSINKVFPLLQLSLGRLNFSDKVTDEFIETVLINKSALPFFSFFNYSLPIDDYNYKYKIIGISLTSIDQLIPTII